MELPGLLKKIASRFSGVAIKSSVEFPGVIKKKSCGTFRSGLSFRS